MHRLVVEFIGAFFLVLVSGLTSLQPAEGQQAFAPLAVAGVLLCLTYAGAHLSGGHYNPAVSLAVWRRGKLSLADLPRYITAQVLGAAAGAFLAVYFKGESGPGGAEFFDPGRVILGEFLFTFLLAHTFLNVVAARGAHGGAFQGLAVGFAWLAGQYAIGPFSGAALNPALAVGACLMKLSGWETLWAYLAPQLLAGLCAGLLFNAAHPRES
jgi:aquaporin Z